MFSTYIALFTGLYLSLHLPLSSNLSIRGIQTGLEEASIIVRYPKGVVIIVTTSVGRIQSHHVKVIGRLLQIHEIDEVVMIPEWVILFANEDTVYIRVAVSILSSVES